MTFTATDNGDCTATFEIVNTTSSDMNDVVYWTGPDRPTEAPAFGKDEGSEVALTSTVEDGQPTWTGDKKYARGYAPTTATANIDFTSVAGDGDTVEVAYRMTGLERDDYDNTLKTVTVTGCAAPTSNGSLGSIFGS
ncbi:hypothetical protein [Rhodococcus sp. NPDC058521]|uniref:hypothetical protein n=1 Tax=Rhodococcus sp. NPDC058521 TaxID=3346536 RepID=UPI0036562731